MNRVISIFLGIVFAVGNANAQVFPKEAEMINPIVIITQYRVKKKGDTCPQATTRAKFPLSVSECNDLLESHGRELKVNTSNPMMQVVVKDRPVFVGDEFVYILSPGGNGWVFIPRDQMR